MSQKEDDGSSAIILAFAMLGAFALVFMMLIFAVAAFITMILTIVALFAWNKPLTICKRRFEPHDARAFIYRGLIGIVTLPAFVIFCSVLFSFSPDWDVIMPYLLLGGYMGGSLGLDLLFLMEEDETPDTQTDVLPTPQVSHNQRALPRPVNQEKNFQYASWDDEEDQE